MILNKLICSLLLSIAFMGCHKSEYTSIAKSDWKWAEGACKSIGKGEDTDFSEEKPSKAYNRLFDVLKTHSENITVMEWTIRGFLNRLEAIYEKHKGEARIYVRLVSCKDSFYLSVKQANFKRLKETHWSKKTEEDLRKLLEANSSN